MQPTYIECTIRLPQTHSEIDEMTAVLINAGFSGFWEEDEQFHCFIPRETWESGTKNIWNDLIFRFCGNNSGRVQITEVQHRNWNEEWEKTIQPIRVTENLIVAPSWNTVAAAEGVIVLTIDPKMSFGTGYHESTRLMLRLMEHTVPRDGIILDIGTGTGILAIAAVKLGARSAIAVDIDEWTAENGKENISRNGLDGYVDIRIGSLDIVPESGFDMILANIQRNIILELLPAMAEKLKPSGTLLLSGLTADDEKYIDEALMAHRFIQKMKYSENEWISIFAERSSLG